MNRTLILLLFVLSAMVDVSTAKTIYRETLAPGERAIVVFCLVSKLAEPAPSR